MCAPPSYSELEAVYLVQLSARVIDGKMLIFKGKEVFKHIKHVDCFLMFIMNQWFSTVFCPVRERNLFVTPEIHRPQNKVVTSQSKNKKLKYKIKHSFKGGLTLRFLYWERKLFTHR